MELNLFRNFLIIVTIIYISPCHWTAYQTHYNNYLISHFLPSVENIPAKINQKAPILQFLEPLILRFQSPQYPLEYYQPHSCKAQCHIFNTIDCKRVWIVVVCTSSQQMHSSWNKEVLTIPKTISYHILHVFTTQYKTHDRLRCHFHRSMEPGK